MIIQQEDHPNVTVLALTGDFTNPSISELKTRIEKLLNENRCNIVMDMEGVSFIDSRSIMQLLRLNREALGAGGEIKLLRPRNIVKRFMNIGHVLDLFERFETKIEAIQSFANSKRSGRGRIEPVNKIAEASLRQRQVLLRLIELLQKKGYLHTEDFQKALKQSSQKILDIFSNEFRFI